VPSQTTTIGPLTLPIPAGDMGSRIADPAIDGLLDFLAFFIKNTLDAKLAVLQQTSSDACPTANRYPWDPTSPRAPRVKVRIPALFMWWDGNSTTIEYTRIYKLRRRELGLLYVFDELSTTTTLDQHDGLLSAVDGALVKASDRGYHPLYGYDAAPLGTPIRVSLGGLDSFMFDVTSRTVGRFGIDTSSGGGRSSKRDRGNSEAGRDYPALRATVVVHERVGQDVLEDPADVDRDTVVTIRASDGQTGETVTILEGLVPMSDGTDPDQQ
jgi:hypothetical protein